MNSQSNKPTTGAASGNAPVMGGSSLFGATASPTQRQVAGALSKALDAIRDICDEPELPSQTIAVLLQVASRVTPPNVLELAPLTGMSTGSASRLVQTLGRGMRGKEGYGLLESIEDPTNYTRKIVQLTPKGVRLMSTLELILINSMKG